MLLLLIAGSTFAATLGGGLFALGLKDKRHLVLGFSAGAVIAVAFFDLLPEAIELARTYHPPAAILSAAALGFLLYLLLDRLIVLHSHAADEDDHARHRPNLWRGAFGAGSLSLHSFLDGIAIGLAFSASESVGIIVAIAVLTHDFSDGINTLNIVLKNGGDRSRALYWLLADALAPVLGIGSTLLFTLPGDTLGLILGVFAGFFLYIGASDLIPESYHAHPKFLTTVMTLAGAGILFAAVKLAGL